LEEQNAKSNQPFSPFSFHFLIFGLRQLQQVFFEDFSDKEESLGFSFVEILDLLKAINSGFFLKSLRNELFQHSCFEFFLPEIYLVEGQIDVSFSCFSHLPH